MWSGVGVIAVLATVRAQGMGPFDAELTEIRQCEDIETTGAFRFLTSRISKHSKTNSTYSTRMVFTEPLDDRLSNRFQFAILGNGGYKPNGYVWEGQHMCAQLRKFFPDVGKAVLNQINETDCPIPPGDYAIRGIPVEYFANIKSVKTFMYGKYRCDAIIIDGDTNKGCMSFFLDVKPKKTGGKGKRGK